MVKKSETYKELELRIQETGDALNQLTQSFDNLLFTSENLIEEISDSDGIKKSVGYLGLNFITLRNAMCSRYTINEQIWKPKFLATSGNGPWLEKEFDSFLKEYGFELYQIPDEEIDGLVLGIEGWDEDLISEQIYDRDTNNLKVYTQELFVLGMIMGMDPYEFLEQEAIDEVGKLHPAIQFILNRDFNWPWPTDINPSDLNNDVFPEFDWASESVLKIMGYSARATGPDDETRRGILRRAFVQDLPINSITADQRSKWGSKLSATRLFAISNFIGWLVNFQGNDKPAAKAKWISDLDWLKKNFYQKTMKFSWPDTGLGNNFKNPNNVGVAVRVTPSVGSVETPKTSSPTIGVNSRITVNTRLWRIVGDGVLTLRDAEKKFNDYVSSRNLDSGVVIRADKLISDLTGKQVIYRYDIPSIIIENSFVAR
jgi:hypothetical protein